MRKIISIPFLVAADMVFAYNPFFHAHTDALDRMFSKFRWYRRLTYSAWRHPPTGWTRVLPGETLEPAEYWGYQV